MGHHWVTCIGCRVEEVVVRRIVFHVFVSKDLSTSPKQIQRVSNINGGTPLRKGHAWHDGSDTGSAIQTYISYVGR